MADNNSGLSESRIAYLEGLVSQARTAAAVFTQFTQEDVDRIVKPMVLAGMEQAQHLARLAIEETRSACWKTRPSRTWWPRSSSTTTSRTSAPSASFANFPSAAWWKWPNPSASSSRSPRSPTPPPRCCSSASWPSRRAMRWIFSPHPKAWRCCAEAVRIMYEAAVKHGAPEGVFTCLESPTLEDNAYLMHHKDVRLIDATGGPGAVKAAYSSGKPALGVGAGQHAGLSGKDRGPGHGGGGHHHLQDLRQRNHLRLRADGGDRRRDLRPRAEEIRRPGRAHLQRKGDRAAGAHRHRSGNRIHAAHGGGTESRRHRALRRASRSSPTPSCWSRPSKASAASIRCRWRNCFRCWRSIGRSPSTRR